MAWRSQSSKKSNKITTAVILSAYYAIIAVYVYYLFGSLLESWWHIQNDHQIMNYLFSTQGHLSNVWKTFLSVDYAVPGRNMFRPYHVLSLIFQSIVFGGNPIYFSIFRLLVFSIFLFCCWDIFRVYTSKFSALIVVFIIIGHKFWFEMLSDTGPCEYSGVLGLTMYMWALHKLLTTRKINNIIFCIIFLVGFLIAILSKENYMVLLIASSIIYLFFRKVLNSTSRVFLLISIVLGLAVSFVVVYGVLRDGFDIYMRNIDLLSRAAIAGKSLVLGQYYWIFLLTLFSWILYAIINRFKKCIHQRILVFFKTIGIVGAIFLIFYYSQLFYYLGNLPSLDRYDFPSDFFADIYIVSICISVSRLISSCSHNFYSNLYFPVLVITYILLNGNTISSHVFCRTHSEMHKENTLNFRNNFFVLVNQSFTTSPAVFVVRHPLEYEYILSIISFANYYASVAFAKFI